MIPYGAAYSFSFNSPAPDEIRCSAEHPIRGTRCWRDAEHSVKYGYYNFPLQPREHFASVDTPWEDEITGVTHTSKQQVLWVDESEVK